jgi:glycosyltransferase involved in cell wall biosynthesis
VANILGVLVARAAGVETVVASRRDYGEWMNRRYLAGTKFANRFVSAIVTNSHEVKRLTERAEGFCSDRIHVIYNGMDARAFEEVRPTQELRRRLGLPQGTKVVVLVANYRPMKRHETLVAAARDVLARRHDVRFLLIGRNATPAKLREAFEAQVAELGLADYIRFTEATGDIREHLALCDVGVNCSQGEGLSNAIMEYMAAGLPCVVADSGGNPDLVTNGVTGLLFPLGDASALAAAIEVLLDDPERRALLGQAGRERVRRDMSLDAMLTSLEALYATLVSSAAKHPQAAM